MTDQDRHPDPLSIIKNLSPGTGVIIRHYSIPGREELVQKIAAVCKQQKLPFWVANDIALAQRVGADGVHFPEWAFRGGNVFPPIDPGWIVFASAHNIPAIKRAEILEADALLLAPVFATASHPDRQTLGISGFSKLAAATNLPVYALGGISHENLKELPAPKNLAGYAGISIFEN